MIPPREFLRSVEHVWLIWLAALVLLALLTRKMLRGFRWSDCRTLLRREEGAAYSLSYVLAFPLYLILVCLIVECTLILLTKIGTAYAAYAGARSAIVWTSMGPDQADQKRDQAVVQALTPFSSSSDLHAQGAGVSSTPSQAARQYVQACEAYSKGRAPAAYLLAKYGYAEKAARAQTRSSSLDWDADITVTVTYEAPFTVPIIGRILGKRAPWSGARFYTYTIVSEATLQNEAPKNADGRLGIDYHVPD
jgi:Flp pilus assembly protein TadG